MAKRICRTANRFDPTGVPWPRCCVRRATPPSCTAVVHEISQRDKDAFIFAEGCAGLARRQTGRDHSLPPGPGRAAPPICSDLIYDRHNNRACGETDPLMVDPEYARNKSPTGELLQHPIFVTTIAFYSLGEKGIGTWIRTPGARNPQQRIEISEPFRYGEIISTTITTADKFVQRGKPYLQMLLEFRNEKGVLKARWWCSLILPATRADVARFANA